MGKELGSETFQRKTFPSGDVLWRNGDPSDFVCLIVSGAIALYRVSESGKETLIGNFGPNELVGENALLGNEPRSTTARAIEKTVVIITDGEELRQRIAEFDKVSAIIIQNLMHKLKMAVTKLSRELDAHEQDQGKGSQNESGQGLAPSANRMHGDNQVGHGTAQDRGRATGTNQVGVGSRQSDPSGRRVDWDEQQVKKKKRSRNIKAAVLGMLVTPILLLGVLDVVVRALPALPETAIPDVVKEFAKKDREWRPDTSFKVSSLNNRDKPESRVAAANVVIREWPYDDAMQVGSAKKGDVLNVTGVTDAGGIKWLRIIRFGGKIGYVKQAGVKMF